MFVTLAGGKKIRWSPIAESQTEMIELIRRAARRLGLVEVEFDASSPSSRSRTADGSRLVRRLRRHTRQRGRHPPLLAIRRHRSSTSPSTTRFGWASGRSRRLSSCGMRSLPASTSSLPATGARARPRCYELCALSDPLTDERVITVEKGLTELGLHHCPDRLPNVAALFSRPASAEGDGEVTVGSDPRPLSPPRPHQVVVGEVLGDEVGPALDVFAGSTRGWPARCMRGRRKGS